jgi:RNA polymerase sigma factor (sigma-70 family)
VSGFETTLWSLIRDAREGHESRFAQFVERYRPAVVRFLVRRGLADDAEDLAQEVFLRLVRDQVLTRADPGRGRFRSLLLAVTRNVLGHHLERERAAKRGMACTEPLGARDPAEPAETDEFDRQFVSRLIELALDRLRREHPHYFEALRNDLLDAHHEAQPDASTVPPQVRYNHRSRGRRKLIEYLKSEVRDYSASHPEYEEELGYLSRFFPNSS